MIVGGTIGNLLFLLKPQLFKPQIFGGAVLETVMGLFTGMFVGGLIMSLAEVLDVFPILFRRGRIHVGIPWMVLAMGIGKAVGAYLYFINL